MHIYIFTIRRCWKGTLDLERAGAQIFMLFASVRFFLSLKCGLGAYFKRESGPDLEWAGFLIFMKLFSYFQFWLFFLFIFSEAVAVMWDEMFFCLG